MTCFDFRWSFAVFWCCERLSDILKSCVKWFSPISLGLYSKLHSKAKAQALKKCWTEGKNESHEEKKLSSTRNVFNGYRILTVMLSAFHIDKADRKKPDGTWCLKYVHMIKSLHTRSRIKRHLETYFCQNHYLHRYKIIICHWLK